MYPWRDTQSHFHLLVAEMMLQRTRADQVLPVYLRAVGRYSTPAMMARARARDLQRLLKPLGLAWRVRNFKAMAVTLARDLGGVVPETRHELKSLPGVGDYIAGAVLSIGFGKREWIVDANVVRLFERYFGLSTSSEGRRDAHIIEVSKLYCRSTKARAANLAMLDHTALVCVPRTPRCKSCPLGRSCVHVLTTAGA